MNNLWWYLFVGTWGGETRIRIVLALHDRSMNANQLSRKLSMDYKTVQHHLKILSDNDVVSLMKGGSYGAMYFISETMKDSWNDFWEIWDRFRMDLGKLFKEINMGWEYGIFDESNICTYSH